MYILDSVIVNNIDAVFDFENCRKLITTNFGDILGCFKGGSERVNPDGFGYDAALRDINSLTLSRRSRGHSLSAKFQARFCHAEASVQNIVFCSTLDFPPPFTSTGEMM